MRRLFLTAALLFAATATDALACPLCKIANENTDERPRAYMLSILFMLGMMGTVSSGVGGLIGWVNKQERKQLEDAGYGHVLHNGVGEFGKPSVAADEQPPSA
jgi:hypothetical protein